MLDSKLKQLARNSRPSVRVRAALELAKEAGVEAAAELRKLAFHDESAEVRYEARRALERHRQTFLAVPTPAACASRVQDVASFDSALDSGQASRQVEAIAWAVRSGHSAGLARLNALAKTELDPEVRSAIATALGRLGSASEVPSLVPLLVDANARVRANALEALAYLNSAYWTSNASCTGASQASELPIAWVGMTNGERSPSMPTVRPMSPWSSVGRPASASRPF
ncbi:MAG: HEAT repeat domain-containing protein [Candidatus Riflebacteria bacterium]|nr:HEAT repeat domain-containing protein [Candidatus Riflebacteria bacterium]